MERILLFIADIVVSSLVSYFTLKIVMPKITRRFFFTFSIMYTITAIINWNINPTYSPFYSRIITFLIVAMIAFFILRRKGIKV